MAKLSRFSTSATSFGTAAMMRYATPVDCCAPLDESDVEDDGDDCFLMPNAVVGEDAALPSKLFNLFRPMILPGFGDDVIDEVLSDELTLTQIRFRSTTSIYLNAFGL